MLQKFMMTDVYKVRYKHALIKLTFFGLNVS